MRVKIHISNTSKRIFGLFMDEEILKTEREYFNKNFNISYIDESLPKADNRIILKHYFCSLLVYGVMIMLLWLNPFFSKISSEQVKDFYNILYMCYVIIAPVIYFIFRPKSIWKSHNIAICDYVRRVFLHLPKFASLKVSEIKEELKCFIPSYTEQQSIVLMFIKFFFGVLMVSSLANNIHTISQRTYTYNKLYEMFVTAVSSLDWTMIKDFFVKYKNVLYNNAIIFLFSLDLSIFCFGYLTELGFLRNKIRTVETTPAGLFFCLICYPPFAAITAEFISLPQNDNIMAFGDINSPLTWIFRICAIGFLVIYVAASVALGFKGSNLTNRGTVSCFPYNIVRHPAYISKNIFWTLTTLPVFLVDFGAADFNFAKYFTNIALVICALITTYAVYYMRALTEERHLIKDPDYQKYTQKVKYRFIPFVI